MELVQWELPSLVLARKHQARSQSQRQDHIPKNYCGSQRKEQRGTCYWCDHSWQREGKSFAALCCQDTWRPGAREEARKEAMQLTINRWLQGTFLRTMLAPVLHQSFRIVHVCWRSLVLMMMRRPEDIHCHPSIVPPPPSTMFHKGVRDISRHQSTCVQTAEAWAKPEPR